MSHKIETLALHAGQSKDAPQNSRGIPVYRTVSYLFNDAEHARNLFALKELGNIYTRLMNPTQDILEQRVAALENGAAALALASGTSAIYYSIINLAKHGDEIVASKFLYGGTYTMFTEILPQFGITVKLVDIRDISAIEAAITDKTRAVFAESIGNPTLDVVDFEEVAKVAHAHHLPFIVDSTFATPYLVNPLEHGADIVVHSLTKWMGGHNAGLGGVVVDSGKFDWTNSKFELFNQPDASYHGVKFATDLGPLSPLAYILRMRVVPLRNLGAAITPDNAWIILQGIETLPLRMERHSENALAVAKHLENHPKVDWVIYPGLPGSKNHEVAKKYFKKGFGGMVIFGIKGGASSGEKFIEELEIFSHVANVGDAKSLAIHPASTTHSQLSEQQQEDAGITSNLIRLSVGLEHIDDIISDIDNALEKA